MPATPARQLALRVLLECDRGGPTLADRLAEPDARQLDARERSFLHELVLGTLRRRGLLDFALSPCLDRSLDQLDAVVRAILRLGAHQLLHLRVPDRAAVSESVELARQAAPRTAGFVNAVLRRLVRSGAPALPDPSKDPARWLTSAGSLPSWLAERWLARLGPADAVRRAEAFLERPPNAYRLNPRIADAAARAASLEPVALAVPGAWRATTGEPKLLADEGVIFLQDQGSQLVAQLAAGASLTLDACAAPGGKATLLGDLAAPGGSVVAGEVSPRRLRTLSLLARRWGSRNLHVVGADALRPPFAPVFDAVLLDAPCSGLGTLARHPDIRWRLSPEDIPRHALRQLELLDRLSRVVRPGGRLVYATCSTEPEENEDVVQAFRSDHPGFSLVAPPAWARPFAEGGHVRTRPERHQSDGFFAAVLARVGTAIEV